MKKVFTKDEQTKLELLEKHHDLIVGCKVTYNKSLEAIFAAMDEYAKQSHQAAVNGSLPLAKCQCGQNALPFRAVSYTDKCSRCGNDY